MALKKLALRHVQRAETAQVSMHDDAALVAAFRQKLAGRASPLDKVAQCDMDQARAEFHDLPEVAGNPFPAPRRPSIKRG